MPGATGGSTVGKLQSPLDPLQSPFDLLDLGILIDLGDMRAALVALYRAKSQDDLAHVVAQSVDPTANVPEMLEDNIGRLFGHDAKTQSGCNSVKATQLHCVSQEHIVNNL